MVNFLLYHLLLLDLFDYYISEFKNSSLCVAAKMLVGYFAHHVLIKEV